jgi:hypothetical protein
VAGKAVAGRESNDAGCPRDLPAVPIQHTPLDTGARRCEPLRFIGEADRVFTEVGIDLHL